MIHLTTLSEGKATQHRIIRRLIDNGLQKVRSKSLWRNLRNYPDLNLQGLSKSIKNLSLTVEQFFSFVITPHTITYIELFRIIHGKRAVSAKFVFRVSLESSFFETFPLR
jgi:hypothetical protein